MKLHHKFVPAAILILIGIIFILKNIFNVDVFSVFQVIGIDKLWPIALVIYGGYMFWKYSQK